MQVATQHPEAISQSTRVGVIEGLLLDGIALRAGHVAPRHEKFAALVVPDLANAQLPVRYAAAMPASITAHKAPLELLIKLTFSDGLV
jgi:hypothetical protein